MNQHITALYADVFENLLIHLTDDQIFELYQNSELKPRIGQIFRKNNFWRRRVEVLLESNVEDREMNWKDLYDLLVHYIKQFKGRYEELYQFVAESDPSSIQQDLLLVLLETGKVSPTFDEGFPMENACENGYLDIVKFLVDSCLVDPSIDNNKAIRTAAQCTKFNVIEYLIEDPRVNPNVDFEVLWFSTAYASVKFLQKLLKDPRIKVDNSIIYAAFHSGNMNIVHLVLGDSRIIPAANPEYLFAAVEGGNIEIVKLVLEDFGIDPAANSNEAIIEAALHEKDKIAKLLLSYPEVNPSARNNTALKCAIDNNDYLMIELLLNDSRMVLDEETKKYLRQYEDIKAK